MDSKVKAIKHILYLVNESTRITNDVHLDDIEIETYFSEVQTTVKYIREVIPVTIDIEECMQSLYTKEPKPYLWLGWNVIAFRLFGKWRPSSNREQRMLDNDLKRKIAENKTAPIHLYRAVAREEILSGIVPTL